MSKLGAGTLLESIHQGLLFKRLKENPRAIRAYEGSAVDGAWILGPLDGLTPDSTWPERLDLVLSNSSESAADFPSHVHASDLDRPPLPCLHYVDCGTFAMRDVEQSGLLFPSEYVDHELLEQRHSDSFGNPTKSARHEKAVASDRVAHLADLEEYLLAPWMGFHVREGKEFDDAVVNFADAQNDPGEAPLS